MRPPAGRSLAAGPGLPYNAGMNGKRWIAAAALTLLSGAITPCTGADNVKPVVITSAGLNARPTIAWNSTDDRFLVVWSALPTTAKWHRLTVNAAIVTTGGNLAVSPVFAISRPSGKKLYSPFTAAAWHADTGQFVILWHENLGDNGSLMLTTLDGAGTIIKRGLEIAELNGALLSAPVLWRSSAETMATLWGEVNQDACRSKMMLIDPLRPNTSGYVPVELTASSKLVEIPLAVTPGSDDAGTVYGFYANLTNGNQRSLYSRTARPFAGAAAPRTVATARKLAQGQTVAAAPGVDTDLVVYDTHIPKKGIDALAAFEYSPGGQKVTNPPHLTGAGSQSFDGIALAPATDGRHRVVAIEQSGGTWSLVLYALAADGIPEAESQTLYSAKRPLSFPAAAWGHGQQTLLIAWCEDTPAGGVRLLAAQIANP